MHVRAACLPDSTLSLCFGRSGGSFDGARVNSFGRVIQVSVRPGERARIKNAKL